MKSHHSLLTVAVVVLHLILRSIHCGAGFSFLFWLTSVVVLFPIAPIEARYVIKVILNDGVMPTIDGDYCNEEDLLLIDAVIRGETNAVEDKGAVTTTNDNNTTSTVGDNGCVTMSGDAVGNDGAVMMSANTNTVEDNGTVVSGDTSTVGNVGVVMMSDNTNTVGDGGTVTSVDTNTAVDGGTVTSVDTNTAVDDGAVTSGDTNTVGDGGTVTSVDTNTAVDDGAVTSADTNTVVDDGAVVSDDTNTAGGGGTVTSVDTNTAVDDGAVTSVDTNTVVDDGAVTSGDTNTVGDGGIRRHRRLDIPTRRKPKVEMKLVTVVNDDIEKNHIPTRSMLTYAKKCADYCKLYAPGTCRVSKCVGYRRQRQLRHHQQQRRLDICDDNIDRVTMDLRVIESQLSRSCQKVLKNPTSITCFDELQYAMIESFTLWDTDTKSIVQENVPYDGTFCISNTTTTTPRYNIEAIPNSCVEEVRLRLMGPHGCVLKTNTIMEGPYTIFGSTTDSHGDYDALRGRRLSLGTYQLTTELPGSLSPSKQLRFHIKNC